MAQFTNDNQVFIPVAIYQLPTAIQYTKTIPPPLFLNLGIYYTFDYFFFVFTFFWMYDLYFLSVNYMTYGIMILASSLKYMKFNLNTRHILRKKTPK